MISDRSEIVFFDVETTIPSRPGQAYALLEFGAILVCPKKLVELESYSNVVRPRNLSLITPKSVLCNGITKEDVVSAPSFSEIADKVYEILHGRIWAGHNILRFDCTRIQEAFAEINRPPPEPKGTIDSLVLLTQRFGRRAGNMKMATLAAYFGLGQQSHRSLDDVRMNLEVLKYCATVLFLESSLPDLYPENSWVSPNANTRSRSNEKASPYGIVVNSTSSSSVEIQHAQLTIHTNQREVANHPILSRLTLNTGDQVVHHVESNIACPDPFDMGQLNEEVGRECLQSDETMEEESGSQPPETRTAAEREASSGHTNFLEPDEVHIPSISVSLTPFYPGTQRIHISHKDTTLQLRCTRLKVRFGISTKFVDHAGRPRLSFVVDSSANLCQVLDGCDTLAQRLSLDFGSSSEWRPVLTRKAGFFNAPSLRLNIPTVADGNITRWVTDIYEKGSSTAPHRLVFSRFDPAELDALITPGSFVDAFFSLDTYDYQQSAGIRLVAKKLILHSN